MTTEPQLLSDRVRAALDTRLEQLPPATLQRLAAARSTALAARPQPVFQKTQPAAAGTSATARSRRALFALPGFWGPGVAAGLALTVAIAGIVGLYETEHQQRLLETAEFDALVLTDELPLSAYADQGFNAYLANR